MGAQLQETMKIVVPEAVTDAILDSSNVPETDYTEWTAGSYSTGDRRMVATGTPDIHRNFESLVNTNATDPVDDQPPPLGTGTGANWLDLGPTNTWALLDTKVGTETTNPDTIDFSVTFGSVINSVAMLNVNAQFVQVIVTDPIEGEVYNTTKSMISDLGIDNWYDYYFGAIERSSTALFLDLPAYSEATINVIIDDDGAAPSCGICTFGVQRDLGTSLHGTNLEIIDFSIKGTDDFGNFTIVERDNSKEANYVITVDNDRLDAIIAVIRSVLTVPAVWIGSENLAYTVSYGFYNDSSIVLSGPERTSLTIDITGLT